MIINANLVKHQGTEVYEIVSDSDNDKAVGEIEKWCLENKCTRSGERHLNTTVRNGIVYRYALAYPNATSARQGNEIYEMLVVPGLTSSDIGRIAAIDCDTRDYAIGANEIEAISNVRGRHPEARIFLKRIGYATVGGVGSATSRSFEL